MPDDITLATGAAPLVLMDGDQLYNSIMGAIEPDLTTDKIPTLPELYKDETPEARTARAARYDAAFAQYEVELKKYQEDWNAQFRTYKKQAMSSLEQESAAKESEEMTNLDSAIAQS